MSQEKDTLEKARYVFEKYTQERMAELNVIFYLPLEEKKPENKTPYNICHDFYLYKQEYFFPLIFYRGLKTYNSILLSNKLSKEKDFNKKLELINKFYIPPILVRDEKSFLFVNSFIAQQHLEKTAGTALLMHLIHEFEVLVEQKPNEIFTSLTNVTYIDFKKHNCLIVDNKKYINLKPVLNAYLFDTTKINLHYELLEDQKTLAKQPNPEDIIKVYESVLENSYADVKKEMSDNTGFGKMDFSQKREHQQQSNIPTPQQNNNTNKNNNQNKKKSGRKK